MGAASHPGGGALLVCIRGERPAIAGDLVGHVEDGNDYQRSCYIAERRGDETDSNEQ